MKLSAPIEQNGAGSSSSNLDIGIQYNSTGYRIAKSGRRIAHSQSVEPTNWTENGVKRCISQCSGQRNVSEQEESTGARV
ncbi:hypothetical protein CCMA1212_006975 [Trichoderma ghanense]|uniref:Uncharacterized protein n=1 Tax=Trichoderma ghanense TaxID=65468 RepID=A0ABY2GZS2_9HYPO